MLLSDQGRSEIHDINLAQICRNLRPGRCCQGRPLPSTLLTRLGIGQRGSSPHYAVALVTHLQPLDIAAVWEPDERRPRRGCTNRPFATGVGPGSFHAPSLLDGPAGNRPVSGVSYIKLPLKIPTDKRASPMLAAQGILGLITGGGKYVDPRSKKSVQQKASDAYRIFETTMVSRRGIISADKGLVFAQPPPDSVWPDLIIVNGTNYTESSPGGSFYQSAEGLTIDFSGT
ncbi:MAG: hypothetical protein Q9207_007802 [Kuettlingeria erythrocarpa]